MLKNNNSNKGNQLFRHLPLLDLKVSTTLIPDTMAQVVLSRQVPPGDGHQVGWGWG